MTKSHNNPPASGWAHNRGSGAKKSDVVMKLEGVCKVYKMGEESLYALNKVDLEIRRGEFIGIIGPSGSGKSTLLNMLGLLDIPSCGRIMLDGTDITRLSEKELAYLRGKKIGFIFQMFNLIPSLTVLENVTLPATIYEEDKKESEKRATGILEGIDMGERLHHYPNQLSGGQRQRAAIARSLINNPEIILADEPTGNLDTKTGQEVLRRFKELHGEGKTIIIVTHDPDVAKITGRTIHVVDGKVQK
ncbi:MAG: ABC transporter ATP-binding protein [Candidatus Micrarchaeia archaeon]